MCRVPVCPRDQGVGACTRVLPAGPSALTIPREGSPPGLTTGIASGVASRESKRITRKAVLSWLPQFVLCPARPSLRQGL